MDNFIIAFLSLSFLIGIIVYIAIPVTKVWKKSIITLIFACIIGGMFFGYSDMLGRPKSALFDIFKSEKTVKVIGSYIKENEGIYLWLVFPNVNEPRYYKFPWDKNLAEDLQKAIQKNKEQHGGGVATTLPFSGSWDKEKPKFYPLPQPRLPDKPNEVPPSYTYQGPEQRA